MESEYSQEYKKLESEIAKGMEQVKQLRASSSGNKETVLGIMLASYEEALEILSDVASEGPPSSDAASEGPPSDKPGSSDRVRKRRALPIWAEIVKVTSADASKRLQDDGYCWRKYGQKDVPGSRYPRAYFRCTHRLEQGCPATKQVQRSEDDPCVFEITYRGKHTCRSLGSVAPDGITEKTTII